MNPRCVPVCPSHVAGFPLPRCVLQNQRCLWLPLFDEKVARVKGVRAAMSTQLPKASAPSPARHQRLVVLDTVIRRDAAQRLSLALTLLARAANEDGADPTAALAQPGDLFAASGEPTPSLEEQSA